MKKIKAIIIEDEAPAAELLKIYFQKHPEIEVIEICKDGFSGIQSIQKYNPDLIILDIQMPKITGFEMLELIENPPLIIFTTAYDEYAIKAFELNAIDYLLKPFSQERFSFAIAKAIEMISIKNIKGPQKIKHLLNEPHPNSKYIKRIVVKKNNRIIVLPANQISHIEAYDDYVIIHSNNEKYLKQKTMKFYEKYLDPNKFIRIHRSWIANIDFINEIFLWEKNTYMVKLKSGDELRASRAGYQKLKELF